MYREEALRTLLVCLVLAGLIAAPAFWFARRAVRRRALARAPLPARWREILESKVAYYRRLPETERRRFEGEIAIFLDEQVVTGPRGAPVEDALRLLVAASAVILVFGRRGFRYPRLRDVVVYARAFDEEYRERARGSILGMVHGQGPVVLSAKHLEEGFETAGDGLNVGLHELAHVLDFEAGRADGAPTFMPWRALRPWTSIMQREVERIAARRSILRKYATTNEAEFFAVATEAFFERARAMREQHPELYGMMREIYAQDPAAREESRA